MSRRMMLIAGAVLAVVVAGVAWYILSRPSLPAGFAAGNGRLEAKEVYIAAKYPGRIKDVLYDEGDTVEAGQVIARMDTETLEAQLRQAQATIEEAQAKTEAAQSNKKYAQAQVSVRQADYTYADKQYERSRDLVTHAAVSEKEAEVDLARKGMTSAEVIGAQAQVAQTQAAIDAAEAEVNAAKAEAERLQAEIKDATLVSPIRGRIESRLAEPGEVLASGGRVYSVVDLSDVYMYVFLPERVTGKVALGSEARIVLDAAPQYPIRAYVSYVSPMAQFTPKTVETQEERHNLTFRVKLQIDKKRLQAFEQLVKVGIPGMGYVRFDQQAAWPAKLEVKAVDPGKVWNPTGSSAPK